MCYGVGPSRSVVTDAMVRLVILVSAIVMCYNSQITLHNNTDIK